MAIVGVKRPDIVTKKNGGDDQCQNDWRRPEAGQHQHGGDGEDGDAGEDVELVVPVGETSEQGSCEKRGRASAEIDELELRLIEAGVGDE